MVLVALRREKNQWILLLQNWWDRMQFVEVTEEYFLSSEAVLVWAVDPQVDFGISGSAIIAERYAESCVDGYDYYEPVFDGVE